MGMNEEDVEQLEITLGNVKAQLNNVKRFKEIAYQMLNLALGSKINTQLILTDDLDSLTSRNIDLNILSTSFNVNNHIDFRIAENDKESKRLLMRYEQSQALPRLSAFINYGTQAFAEDFNFFSSNQRWFQQSLLGVSLNVPIFSSLGRSAKTAQAKIAFETADLRFEETKQRLALAERIEKKQRIKFFEGLSTSFELSQAQNQLYTQQQNYIQSMLDVIAK